MARYRFVAAYLRGVALDIGCGRGYGFEAIAPHTSRQVGLDVSRGKLLNAGAEFPLIPFVLGTGQLLPLASESFDSVVALEVIEHTGDAHQLLRETVRVARPGGVVAVSTPNRLVVSRGAAVPLNPFHVREFTIGEFRELLHPVFPSVVVFGQHDEWRGSASGKGLRNSLVDLIPSRWKHLLPAHVQQTLSVIVRPPLRPDDCRFESSNLDSASVFVAICRV